MLIPEQHPSFILSQIRSYASVYSDNLGVLGYIINWRVHGVCRSQILKQHPSIFTKSNQDLGIYSSVYSGSLGPLSYLISWSLKGTWHVQESDFEIRHQIVRIYQ